MQEVLNDQANRIEPFVVSYVTPLVSNVARRAE